MRLPTRVHITWEDDATLKLDADAGTQNRMLRFRAPAQRGDRSWQGNSAAMWDTMPVGRAMFGATDGQVPSGALKVVTTNLKPGYLRKNGVPYSENAVLTEYFNVVGDQATGRWLIVTSVVDDPTYLTQRFITSSHFKQEADGSKWNPTACTNR